MVEIPKGVAALGDGVEAKVEGLVRDAQRRQAGQLRQALEDTLRIVPRPLRPLVRKIVGA